jgi:two-component system, cell cycle sensor histidine kinase and response regulator CckA
VKGLPREDELAAFASEIHNAGQRAALLTRQLLAFSRKQILLPSVLNLNTLVADMDQMLRRLIGEDIELVLTLEPTLHPVKADPGQVQQVVLNLVINSRDAMPEGGQLTLSTSNLMLGEDYARSHPEVTPGPYALLEVIDTGCGMDEEVQAHLFEPFFTTKEVGKGTGLGLATVFGIVKQSGGHVEVLSAPRQGTTFKIYLPRFEARPLAPPPVVPEGPEGRLPGGTETILLVEDEDGVRSLVRQMLRRGGYTLLEARNGEEALELYGKHEGPIQLLLTDVVMPRLSGRELAKKMGALHPDMKVLFMSGFTDSTLLRHDVISGEVECLIKPFAGETLVQKVREVLDAPPSSVLRATRQGQAGRSQERRRFARRQTRGRVTVASLSGAPGADANVAEELMDMCKEGVCVVLQVHLERGREVEVNLSGRDSPEATKRTAKVMWSVALGDSRYRTGLRFCRPLNYAEFQQFT